VTGGWRKLHNEELHNVYSSPSIIKIFKSRRMSWTRMGAKRNAYRILVRTPEGRRAGGRPSRRWMGNIKLDLRDIIWDVMDWIDLAQDRYQWRVLTNTKINLRVP
jgi:hypothetical protein